MIENLEEDATNILQFMVSNGLVANSSKTEFMLLNSKDKTAIRIIKVRSAEIQETESAKLLGITMDNDQIWTSHFWGKKGLLQFLNQILYATRRIANHIPKDTFKQVVSMGVKIEFRATTNTQCQTLSGKQEDKIYKGNTNSPK